MYVTEHYNGWSDECCANGSSAYKFGPLSVFHATVMALCKKGQAVLGSAPSMTPPMGSSMHVRALGPLSKANGCRRMPRMSLSTSRGAPELSQQSLVVAGEERPKVSPAQVDAWASVEARGYEGVCLSYRPWVVKCSPGPRARPGPAPEIDAELWKLHNLWRERQQQGKGSQYVQESCRISVSSFERCLSHLCKSSASCLSWPGRCSMPC